jgi:RHH-type transcriptional regulator, proline utilization regulon repressor / proline dehydrogenase / delta 1-pyrroline-5-carboxylate dehydrogenase
MDGFEIAPLTLSKWHQFKPSIMAIQNASYEAGRTDSADYLFSIINSAKSACVLAYHNRIVAGYAFGSPLEQFSKVGGVIDDENYLRHNTLYGADVTVATEYRGQGLGTRLKQAQMQHAKDLGFLFVSGRNRLGLADTMWRMNQSLGAIEVRRIDNAYIDGPLPRVAIYYRIDLGHDV